MDWRRGFDELARNEAGLGESERLRALTDLYWRRLLHENPETATFLGEEGDHDRWSDLSPEAFERRREGTRAMAAAARSIDREALPAADRLDLDVFRWQSDLAEEETAFRDELFAISPIDGPHLSMPRTIGFTRDPDHVLARLEAAPALIAQAIELLREGLAGGVTVPRVVLPGVLSQLDAQIAADTPASPMLAAWRDPPQAARRAAEQIVERAITPALVTLREMIADEYLPQARETIGLSDLDDGDEWYALRARRFTTTALTPKEIHELGVAEVARIRAEMQETIGRTGFDGDLDAFFTHLRSEPRFFYDRAEDLVTGYRDIAKRIDAELPRLFGILPRQPYGVEPVPDHEAEHAPAAYYQRGAPGRAGFFHANTFNLRARPRWEMEALTLHEAVPGHHLQIAIAQELGELSPFRRHARVTAFVEGWALYAERLGEELGLYTDPYSLFGRLTAEMWRAIRLVVDTGMHALGWSREQAISTFVDNAGRAEHDIHVEVDRYIAWPGQALAYKVGELRFTTLRARAAERLGDRFDVRAFHDQCLRHAALPLDVLERLMEEWIAAQ